jgi:hypothetical protein
MKRALPYCAGVMLSVIAPMSIMCQEKGGGAPRVHVDTVRNVLYVNPVHLLNGNVTLSYERFSGWDRSFRVTLSGGEKASYVAAAFDLSYYPAPPTAINYFIAGSLMAYESPIRTGVPVSQPWNRLFESSDDRYYVGLQVKNGALFRLRDSLWFGIDAAIGPGLSLNEGTWLCVWAINLNVGIPF